MGRWFSIVENHVETARGKNAKIIKHRIIARGETVLSRWICSRGVFPRQRANSSQAWTTIAEETAQDLFKVRRKSTGDSIEPRWLHLPNEFHVFNRVYDSSGNGFSLGCALNIRHATAGHESSCLRYSPMVDHLLRRTTLFHNAATCFPSRGVSSLLACLSPSAKRVASFSALYSGNLKLTDRLQNKSIAVEVLIYRTACQIERWQNGWQSENDRPGRKFN